MIDREHDLPEHSEHLGVSVVICCHNSEKLLPATINHLKRQHVSSKLKWEVIIIDNASTDKMATVAHECWGTDGPAPMRIVREARLGLCYARERAFEEAQYEVVSFIDDDNWVAPDWVMTVGECMAADPSLGAIGSINEAVAEGPFPDWFPRWAHYYAAHASCECAMLETWILVGAGMTIRKRAWEQLKRNGFRLQLTDRVGSSLSTCGDLELGCALQLASWRIRVEPRLHLQHYMQEKRLDWKYLRRLVRATGEAMALLDSYFFFWQCGPGLKNRLRQRWWVHVIKEAMELVRQYSIAKVLGSWFRDMEGDDDVAYIEHRLGRLRGLLRLRSKYGALRQNIAQASWRTSCLLTTGVKVDSSP